MVGELIDKYIVLFFMARDLGCLCTLEIDTNCNIIQDSEFFGFRNSR